MPVALFTAATEERLNFNQLHNTCKGRIKQQIFCPGCNIVVPKADLLKGYETEKDKYVIVSEAELEAAEPECARIVELSDFVPAAAVDPVFFESSYYLAPQDGGQKILCLWQRPFPRESASRNRIHPEAGRRCGEGVSMRNLRWRRTASPTLQP